MPYPNEITQISLTIDGQDYTPAIKPGSLSFNDDATQLPTLTATLRNVINLKDLSEVLLSLNNERVFGGLLVSQSNWLRGDEIDVQINATGYALLLRKKYVKEEYIRMTDVDILADLLAYAGITLIEYPAAVVMPRMRFNRRTAFDAIAAVVKMRHGYWYVDANKQAHYFIGDYPVLGFGFSASPDFTSTFPAHYPRPNRQGGKVINAVEVVGGTYRSADITTYLAGTGYDNKISLPFRYHAPDGETSVLMWRNDGDEVNPVWTPLTVKTGNIDQLAGTNEVLYYYQEKVVEQTNPWPNLPNALKIYGKRDIPLRVRVRDDDSIAFYGQVFETVINDSNIVDKTTARLVAKAKLAENAWANPAVNFDTVKSGVKSNHRVTLDFPNVSGTFIVRSIRATVDVNMRIKYAISAGVYNQDLIDYLLSLNNQDDLIWRDDEVLDEYYPKQETMAIIDKGFSYTSDAPPYYFAPANDTAPGALYWGTGTFDP